METLYGPDILLLSLPLSHSPQYVSKLRHECRPGNSTPSLLPPLSVPSATLPALRYCMTLLRVLMDTLPFGNSQAATNTTRRATPASAQDCITAQERMNYHRCFDVLGKLTKGCVTTAGAISCFDPVSKLN